jgi:hypothetical protein
MWIHRLYAERRSGSSGEPSTQNRGHGNADSHFHLHPPGCLNSQFLRVFRKIEVEIYGNSITKGCQHVFRRNSYRQRCRLSFLFTLPNFQFSHSHALVWLYRTACGLYRVLSGSGVKKPKRHQNFALDRRSTQHGCSNERILQAFLTAHRAFRLR